MKEVKNVAKEVKFSWRLIYVNPYTIDLDDADMVNLDDEDCFDLCLHKMNVASPEDALKLFLQYFVEFKNECPEVYEDSMNDTPIIEVLTASLEKKDFLEYLRTSICETEDAYMYCSEFYYPKSYDYSR